jgi:ribosome maturation factor RimP
MNIAENIRELIEPALQAMGIDLVELQVHGLGNRTVVRVFVDETGGIRVDRCTSASRAISDLLDQKDVIPGRYLLEVSSPGTDRPLTTARDYARHMGRTLWLRLGPVEAPKEICGTIRAIEENLLSLETGDGVMQLPLNEIITNKIIVDFRSSSGKRNEK